MHINKSLIFGAIALLFGGIADYLEGEQMKLEVHDAVLEEFNRRFGEQK